MPGQILDCCDYWSMKGCRSEVAMGSIAKRRCPRFLATAKPDCLIALCHILLRGKTCSLVRTVAKRLGSAFAAGAPPVFLIFFNVDAIRLFLGDNRFGHIFFLTEQNRQSPGGASEP